MTNSTPKPSPSAQAIVAGSLNDAASFTGRSGATEFPIGGPDGEGVLKWA